jgi:thiol-disulfide isomerase/thioredoxin
LALAALLVMAPGAAGAQNTPRRLLEIAPALKRGAEYETPTDPAAINACKVETVYKGKNHAIGVALRDGQGKLLRKYIDSDDNGRMDQWSFYQDGFEVYREIDRTNDATSDECRWLNAAGTRVGLLKDGKITAWKRISAEEAAKVLVQALVTADLGLLETVLATPEELAKLGVPKGEVDQVSAAAGQRYEQTNALIKGLTGWNKEFVWNRLDGMMPHLIPAEPDTGLAQDIVLYENAVIFAAPASGEVDPRKIAFLQAPEMIKLGEVWKFVELPRAIPPDKPVVAAADGGIRSWVFRSQLGPGAGLAGPQNAELDAALRELAAFDQKGGDVLAGTDRKAIAQFHVDRVRLLNSVVKAAKSPDEQSTYKKQIIDSLVAAVQTGLYPNGEKLIERLAAEDQGGKLESYAAFRKLGADFALRNEEQGANLMVNQKKWMSDLKSFLEKYPRSDEAPDALLQLASAFEFNAEEDEARTYYTQLAKDFPATEPGKKAAGALARLDLVGKTLVLKGAGLKNDEVDATQFRGKVLLVAFWATWAEPVKRDLPELTKVYQKYHKGGFEIIGVSLDSERRELDAFLKENPLPWPQIFEPGGMDSRLATEYGIISLPTMILVDAQGKVLNRNIRTAAELARQLEKPLAGGSSGVALDVKDVK